MKIVNEVPPNYEEIRAVFNLEGVNAVFAYGDTLYNPTGMKLETHILAHEEVHAEQQGQSPFLAGQWWGKYLKDPVFRLAQEVEAYKRQYQFVKEVVKDRNKVSRFLHVIAGDLSGKMYGNMVSFNEALKLIQG